MELNNLQDLFKDQLIDLHSAEKQLTDALPQMAKKASSKDLREAFENHLETTKEHVGRLDEIGKKLGVKLEGKSCKAMEGLIEEAKHIMQEGGSSKALDAALIAAAQKVEHYEIASYGSVVTYAQQLGEKEAVDLLKRTLDEEEKTDELLSKIAKGGVNEAAMTA